MKDAALYIRLPDWAKDVPADACVTVTELAVSSGCHRSSIYRAVEDGRLPKPVKQTSFGSKSRWRFRVGEVKAAISTARRRNKKGHDYTSTELAMRIALLPRVTPKGLMDRFNVSRATAYRYVQAWHDARGLPRG